MPGRMIEAYCAGDTIVFPAPQGKLRVARGWRLSLPEMRMASNRARNGFKRCAIQALNMIPGNDWAVFQWHASNDIEAPVRDYIRNTPADAPVAVRRLRNRKAIEFLELARKGQLRREVVTFWSGQEVAGGSPRTKDPALRCAEILEASASIGAAGASAIESALSPVGATVERLNRQSILRAWHDTLNPSSNGCRTNLPVPPDEVFSLTDTCWSSELRGLGDQGFHQDGRYYAVWTVAGLPTMTFQGIMDHLTSLPLPDLTITVRVRRLAKEGLMRKLQARLSRLHAQLQRRADPVLRVSCAQIEDKLGQLARNEIVPLEFEIILVTHAPTQEELRARHDLVKNAAARMNGMRLFDATLAVTARNLFLKTLPGWLWSQDPGFLHYGESTYVADLLPLSSSFEGHLDGAEALLVGPYQNLAGLRTFVGEGHAKMPQNLLCAGSTGTGKSVALVMILTETAPYYAYTAIVEEGLSYAPFTEAVGGKPTIITPDGNWKLNIFDGGRVPQSPSMRAAITSTFCLMIGLKDDAEGREGHVEIGNHVAQICQEAASDWLRRQPESERQRIARLALVADRISRENLSDLTDGFLRLREIEETDEGRRLLAAPTDAEVRMFASKHRETVYEVAYAFLDQYPTVGGLRDHLEMEGGQSKMARHLAAQLSPWCAGGLYGKNFDTQGTLAIEGAVTHLELGKIPESAKRLKLVVGFVYLTILLRLHLLKLPLAALKRVIIDEISRFLLIPGAEILLCELFEQFRKKNVQVGLVCQQISQLGSGRLLTAVLGNTRMALLFNLGDPKDLDLLSEHLPLTEAAKSMILRYSRPDQLRGKIYSECCYFHTTSREPMCGTIRFVRPEET